MAHSPAETAQVAAEYSTIASKSPKLGATRGSLECPSNTHLLLPIDFVVQLDNRPKHFSFQDIVIAPPNCNFSMRFFFFFCCCPRFSWIDENLMSNSHTTAIINLISRGWGKASCPQKTDGPASNLARHS